MVARKGSEDQTASNVTDEVPADLAITSHAFTDDQLREIDSIETLLSIVSPEDMVDAAEFLGDGYSTLDDKSRLIGLGFAISKWAMVPGEKSATGKSFSVVWALTKSHEKLRFTDGSTGIHQQLCEIFDRNDGRVAPMYVRGGLRVSAYDYTDDKTGEVSKAKTFYLNV